MFTAHGEVYGFADGAEVWRRVAGFRDLHDRAASAGFGVGLRLAEQGQLNVEPARQVIQPRPTRTSGGWRFVVSFTRDF